VPSAFAGFEQAPVVVSHVPALWHWSDAVHVTEFEPTHTPNAHLSVCVQAFPSLQVVPSALVGFEHTPVVVLQVPALWHWSDALHVTEFEPTHTPDEQLSVCVQALPSEHEVPFVTFWQLEVQQVLAPVVPGSHCSPVSTTPLPHLSPVIAVSEKLP